jgi:hypothetical protein
MRIIRMFLYCRNLFSSNRNNTIKGSKKASEDFNLSENVKESNKNRVDQLKDNKTDIHTDVIEKLLPQSSNSEITVIHADCRLFEEKKDELNDLDLNHYLSIKASKNRRSAVCEKILKEEKNNELLEFMVYLMREDNIKNFLL